MRKNLVFCLLAICLLAFPLACHGQVSYYKSSLSSYVKVDSIASIDMEGSTSKLMLILSRDATFIKEKKTGKTAPFETFLLKVDLLPDEAEKKPPVNQDEVPKPLFNKKSIFVFIIGKEEFSFDDLFANISFNKNAATFEIRKNIFAGLLAKDTQNWSLRLQINDDIVTVPVAEDIIKEWQEILAIDMLQLTESDLPAGKSIK